MTHGTDLFSFSSSHRPRRGFTLVELLVVIVVIGVLVGLLLSAVQQVRESSRQATCVNNLKQWALAMHSYHDANKVFPYFGQRNNNPETTGSGTGTLQRRSFIVPLWPFTEAVDLYNKWDLNKPYDGNASLTQTRQSLYNCPSDRPGAMYRTTSGSTYNMRRINYVLNFGTTGWIANKREAPFGAKSSTGFVANWTLYVPYRTSLSAVTDGSSKTLLMAELRFPADDQGGDANPTGTPASGAVDDRGTVFNDVNTYFTTAAAPNSGTDTVGKCGDLKDPSCSEGSSRLLGGYRYSARSRHRGGVNAAFCDGSVQFIPDTIPLTVWQELSTMNSDKQVGEW